MRAFQTWRSGCSFIGELPTGAAETPSFQQQRSCHRQASQSLINRRFFLAPSALTPGCARAFGRREQREGRGMAIDTAIGGTSAARPGLPGVIIAATIGNVLEWFDFLVYGFFAVTIAEVFFPASNSTVSLLITFGTFGLAYVVRPLGAVIVGTYTDRAGRKAGLTLSIGLMMIGTTLMVITPSYATIGIAAPIIITAARLLQGFSVGGEFGSAVAFLVEHGGERKGFSASWQWATTGIVSVIVSLFGVILTTQLSHEQLVDWGWRIPYVFGLLVGPAGLYIRARVSETADFLKAESPPRCRSPICCADTRFRCCWRSAPPSFRTAPITCSSMSQPTGSRRCICRLIPALLQHWWAGSFSPPSRSLPGTGRTRSGRVRASCSSPPGCSYWPPTRASG